MNPIWTSKKLAILFSYMTTGLNALSTIVLTGLYVDKLGRESYGLYQMIYAVAHYILVLDLGIGLTMNRYVAEFIERKDQTRQENFAFHMLVILSGISALILLFGWVVGYHLNAIYPKLTPDELPFARHMFVVMIVQIVLLVFRHFVSGISLGYDQYALIRLIDATTLIVNFALSVAVVYSGFGFLEIVFARTITLFLFFCVIL